MIGQPNSPKIFKKCQNSWQEPSKITYFILFWIYRWNKLWNSGRRHTGFSKIVAGEFGKLLFMNLVRHWLPMKVCILKQRNPKCLDQVWQANVLWPKLKIWVWGMVFPRLVLLKMGRHVEFKTVSIKVKSKQSSLMSKETSVH